MRKPAPIVDYATPRERWGTFEWALILTVIGIPLTALLILFLIGRVGLA